MDLLSSGQRVQRFRTGIRMMIAVALVVVVGVARLSQVAAQGSSPAERLKQEKSGKNIYRGGVPDAFAAKANMEELFDKILISGPGDGKADKWYEPHLRDQMIDPFNRFLESYRVRGKTRPIKDVWFLCLFSPPGSIEPDYTACPLGACGEPHVWHGEPFSNHRPLSACFGDPTTPYKQLLQDQNFKACCVRQAHKNWTSEQIAAEHPNGDGWAGIFEVFYPWGALGWENDRTTSMIVEKSTIDKCVQDADKVMEGSDAREWVRDGIMRNYKTAKGSSPSQAEVDAVIKDVITKVRPTDKELRFADNLDGEGITVRLNLATLVREYRQKLAARVCGWPNQFDKLLVPGQDPFQSEGGGLDLQSLAGSKIFSNYCPEGVDLMLAAREGPGQRIQNTDSTPTDLAKGYAAWKRDPVYCQAKNIANASLRQSGIADVIQKIGAGGGLLVDDGGSCLPGANLNYSMVPVFYRTSRVERRTDIGGRIMGALIAASLAPGMSNGNKSVMKHFEWQPYTMKRNQQYQTFVGRPFKGGANNELRQPCPQLSGSGLQYKNKSDRLYISNVTHQPFTQEIIDESNNIDKYVQDWAVAWRKQQIASRGLDEMSQNYAAVFRPVAVCPSGMTRWEPPMDEHNEGLSVNLTTFCREEYFGAQP